MDIGGRFRVVGLLEVGLGLVDWDKVSGLRRGLFKPTNESSSLTVLRQVFISPLVFVRKMLYWKVLVNFFTYFFFRRNEIFHCARALYKKRFMFLIVPTLCLLKTLSQKDALNPFIDFFPWRFETFRCANAHILSASNI